MPPPAFSFPINVKSSQKHTLGGRYQAHLDSQGLRLSRKQKVLEIPVGTSASHQSGSSLLVEYQGASVELTVVKPNWYCERLARDLTTFLNGTAPLPRAQDYRIPWYFWVLAILPVGIPFVALGGALWGALGFGLAGLCFVIARRENWPAGLRVIAMLLVSGVGYASLLSVLFFLQVGLPRQSGFLPRIAPAAGTPEPIPLPPVTYNGQRHAFNTDGIPIWLGFSPDGRTLAVGDTNAGLGTYDLATDTPRRKQQPLKTNLRYANFTTDGRRIVAGGFSGGPIVLDPTEGTVISTCEVEADGVRDAAFTAAGKTVLGVAGQSLFEWDASSGKLLRTIGPSVAKLRTLCVRRGGKLIITGGHKSTGAASTLRHDEIWSLEKAAVEGTLPVFTSGSQVANNKGGYDLVRRPFSPRDDESSKAFTVSPDGRFAALVMHSRAVFLLDLVAGKQLPDLVCSGDSWEAAFSPDGSVLAVGNNGGTVDLFEMSRSEKVGHLTSREGHRMIFSLAFAQDGQHLAVGTSTGFGGNERKVCVVDLERAIAGWKSGSKAER